MRILIISIILLMLAFVVKVDLQEGTLPLASFYEKQELCQSEDQLHYVAVQVQQDDTIYSLFAATPSPIKTTFPERLAQFYQLNPHLELQRLLPGNIVRVPITSKVEEICTK